MTSRKPPPGIADKYALQEALLRTSSLSDKLTQEKVAIAFPMRKWLHQAKK